MSKDKSNKNFTYLTIINAIGGILEMFISTFLVAYFYTVTNYNYKIISLFYIASSIITPLCFVCFGNFVKTKNKVIIFRLSMIVYCIYILLIALLKEEIVNYYILVGILHGLAQGLYWVVCNVYINEIAKQEKVSKKFISIKSIVGNVTKIVFPIIFGAAIEFTSFFYIAKIIIPISILQLICSLFLKDINNSTKEKFSLSKYIKYIKENNVERIKKFYKISIYEGVANYLLSTLITVVIVMTFKTTLNLGVLTTVFSILSIISVYIFQKVYKNKNPKRIIIISAIIMFVSVIALVLKLNKITVIIYNLANCMFMVLLRNYALSKRYDSIGNYEEVKKKFLVEHQVVSEIVLGISRTFGYVFLFIMSLLNNIVYFKTTLLIVTVFIMLYAKELYEDR